MGPNPVQPVDLKKRRLGQTPKEVNDIKPQREDGHVQGKEGGLVGAFPHSPEKEPVPHTS